MAYLIKLTGRAVRDLQSIYEFIEAEVSEQAFIWFNDLTEAIYSLERFAERGTVIPESKKYRQLLFRSKASTYRIIYMVDKRHRVVMVLNIRHGARGAFSEEQ